MPDILNHEPTVELSLSRIAEAGDTARAPLLAPPPPVNPYGPHSAYGQGYSRTPRPVTQELTVVGTALVLGFAAGIIVLAAMVADRVEGRASSTPTIMTTSTTRPPSTLPTTRTVVLGGIGRFTTTTTTQPPTTVPPTQAATTTRRPTTVRPRATTRATSPPTTVRAATTTVPATTTSTEAPATTTTTVAPSTTATVGTSTTPTTAATTTAPTTAPPEEVTP